MTLHRHTIIIIDSIISYMTPYPPTFNYPSSSRDAPKGNSEGPLREYIRCPLDHRQATPS